MVSSIPLYPYQQVTANGFFGTTTQGYVQGDSYDDPASRNWLRQGTLSASETLPMWGGVGVYANLPVQGSVSTTVGRASSITNLIGFSTSTQAANWIQTATSSVPTIGSGGSVPFYQFGTNARIMVGIDAVLAANLQGGAINTQVSWDFVTQKLVTGVPAYAANVVTAATWSAGAITYTTTTAHGLVVGSSVTLSGFTPAGYNGTFDVVSVPTTTTFTVAAANPGSATVLGTLNAGGGYLPSSVKVLDIDTLNSMSINYNAVTGTATWNRTGPVALIQI